MASDPDKGWQLPDVVDPSAFWCYKIYIPEDIAYLRAFRGAIALMSYSYNWQRDEANTAAQVSQVWLKQMLQADEMFEAEEECDMIDCQDIIDCINESEELQRLIGKYSLTSSISTETGESSQALGTDLLQGQGVVDCDYDSIYGACLQLTMLLNITAETLLDIFVNSLNNAANLGYLIEAIPVVGELPLDDIAEFLQKVATQVNTAYQAAYDTQLEEDISCLFFCAAKNGCELTLADARDVIRGEIANPVSAQDFISVVNDIIANNWLGEQSVYIIFYFILQTIVFGGEILGQDVKRFARTVATYFNDPNPDWEELCTECSSTICFDMTELGELDIYAGSQDEGFGNPEPSLVGVVTDMTAFPFNASANQAYRRGVAVEYVFESNVTIEQVKFDTWSNTNATGVTAGFIGYGVEIRDDEDTQLYRNAPTDATFEEWVTRSWNIDIEGARKVIVWTIFNTGATSPDGSMFVDNLCITYAESLA